MSSFSFAFSLAWRQLRFEPMRLFTALAGVVFATVLVFMQLGFKDALFDSATLLQRTLTGDLYIIQKQSEALWRMQPFPRQRLYQALPLPGVNTVTAMYVGQTPWKNPETGVNRTAIVFGIDPDSPIYTFQGLDPLRHDLYRNKTVIFDELSRPEFGDVSGLLEKGTLSVEINGKTTDVIGTFRMGITFSADGNLVTSDVTFFYLFPNRSPEGIDLGIISLNPGTDIADVQAQLTRILPEDVIVLTKDEYIQDEKAYWQNVTSIGYVFNFGTILGLIVGLVIVYQVLFNDIVNHLQEYATLKAMGYKDRYFTYVVFSASLILGVLGFIPGVLLSSSLYKVVEKAIFIGMNLAAPKVCLVFVLILAISLLSGLLAIRKLRSANPADVFQ